jgi:uncharacterized protein (TIGR02001 family)
MKITKPVIFAAAFAAVVVTAPSARAAEEAKPAYTLTGNLGFVSDYRFRGISQTAKRPAVQGGFDFAHESGFYLGTWASNVSGNIYNNANLEWDLYGGYNYKLNDDIGLTAGLLYYYYPGGKTSSSSPNDKYDTIEANFGGNWKWISGKLWITAGDFFGVSDPGANPCKFGGSCDNDNGDSKRSTYLEINASYPLAELKLGGPADKVTIVGHVGHQKVRHYGNLDYTDWKIGATYDLNGYVFGLAYVDTNAKHDYYKITDSGGSDRQLSKATVVLSVTKSF